MDQFNYDEVFPWVSFGWCLVAVWDYIFHSVLDMLDCALLSFPLQSPSSAGPVRTPCLLVCVCCSPAFSVCFQGGRICDALCSVSWFTDSSTSRELLRPFVFHALCCSFNLLSSHFGCFSLLPVSHHHVSLLFSPLLTDFIPDNTGHLLFVSGFAPATRRCGSSYY